MHRIFENNRELCINVLPGEHEQLARDFAGMTQMPMSDRFETAKWNLGNKGVPVLHDALASIEGKIVELKDVGSHSIMFIESSQVQVRSDGDGLIYFVRNFHRIKHPDLATTR